MSGEGVIPAFDQRPGALEATREPLSALPPGCADAPAAPRSGLMACGSRGSVSRGWSVLVLATGERAGECCQVVLSIEEARAAAKELNEMCDVLEGRVW